MDEFNTDALFSGKPEPADLSALWKTRIPFDWRDVPATQLGECQSGALTSPETWVVTLTTGRRITLKSFYQDLTYDGYMEGFPPNPDIELRAAYRKAVSLFPYFKKTPVMLRPILYQGQMRLFDKGTESHLEGWQCLAKIRTIAEFVSDRPARDNDEMYSSLVVVWFQDAIGLPKEFQVLRELKWLDWNQCAWDWTD